MNKPTKQLNLNVNNKFETKRKISWVANDIGDFYWEVAKSSYSSAVDPSTPSQHLTKIYFNKEIYPNGYLTDSINSILLNDLKQCLINIVENNGTEKPYRLQAINNNIIYLIISVNEQRSDYGLPPILSFSQITEDNIINFLKSFDIDEASFFSVVDEICRLPRKPKANDWKEIRAKIDISCKTFQIIKHRLQNSKNTELYVSKNSEKKGFNDANTKRNLLEMLLPNKKTIQNYVSDINHLFTSSQDLKEPIKFSPYELIGGDRGLNSLFNDFQIERKTSVIPIEVAFHLISSSLKFQSEYGCAILNYLIAIDEHYKISTAHLCKSTLLKDCQRRKKLFHEVPIPEELKSLKIAALGLEKESHHSNCLKLTEVIQLYSASMYILTASFSATRELSLLKLKRSCFSSSPLDGLYDIKFMQQKSNTNNKLKLICRPIPKRIYELGLQYCQFAEYLEARYEIFHEDTEGYLFTNFHAIKKIITRHFDFLESELIPCHLSGDSMQSALVFFTDWCEVPLINGKRWYASDHQFRRLFAVLYFNLTDEKGIEELSWFLGHENLDMTFHYAEQNPTDEWQDEAILSISKRATSINQNLNTDEEISKVIDSAREESIRLNLQLESVIYEAINDRIRQTGEEVHFERVSDNDIYFYFTQAGRR